MFNLFKKKKINIDKVNEFCEWFILNNENIRESVLNCDKNKQLMYQYLNLVENKLTELYIDFYKREVHFGYGPIPNSDKFVLDLCHFNKKPLIEITKAVQEKLNKELSDKWIVNISK